MTVRNDASRRLIRTAERRPARSVVSRQGQALLDADLDEQSRHLLDRIESGTADSLGSPGRLMVSAGSTAFAITPAPNLANCAIGPGRGYLGGWRLDNAEPGCTLATQPHPRSDTGPANPVLLAIKALVRHVDPVEEPAYADHALGDAQGAGRSLVDWQVFPFAPTGGWPANTSCSTVLANADWGKLVAASTGTLAVVPDTAPPSTDPCSLSPAGGYSRNENLCYRIEVDGGLPRANLPTADGPRFTMKGLRLKMSRRNASVMARITGVDGSKATVEPPALDALNWFAPGLYAEIVSAHDDVDPRDAAGATRMFRVATATDSVVTLEASGAAALAGLTGTWYLRLWDAFPDGSGTVTLPSSGPASPESAAIDLGDGIKVKVGAGAGGPAGATFRRGDYWTFAARSDGTVEWPTGTAHETPHGPLTWYAPLALLTGNPSVAEDCRITTATLTDRALLYRGGDGQEVPAIPGGGFIALPTLLRVAVMRGNTPVNGARVRWSVPTSPATPSSRVTGQVIGGAATAETVTGPEGLAQVDWAIDTQFPADAHRVQAELLDADGLPEGPALLFHAQFRTAADTSYQPGACAVLNQAMNVQEALDELCANLGGGDGKEPETLQITSILLRGGQSGDEELVRDNIILNALDVPHDSFLGGIGVGVSAPPLKCQPTEFDPIIEVELDLPYPGSDWDRLYWTQASGGREGILGPFGFHRVRLDGTVRVIPKRANPFQAGLVWQPGKWATRFIETAEEHLFGTRRVLLLEEQEKLGGWDDGLPRVLCRLRVRSAQVWTIPRNGKERIYLNAEHLGVLDQVTGRELSVAERDPQRAGDLDLFFYLVLKPR